MKRGCCEKFSIQSFKPALSEPYLKWTSQVVHRVFSSSNSQHLILCSYMGTSFPTEIWAHFYLSLQAQASRTWIEYSNLRAQNSKIKKYLMLTVLWRWYSKNMHKFWYVGLIIFERLVLPKLNCFKWTVEE